MKTYISNIIGALVSAVFLVLLIWVNINFFTAGTIIGSALFGGAFALCVFRKPFWRLVKRMWSKTGGKVGLSVVGAVTVVCAAACVFFSVNMARYAEREADEPGAVIVLGC